MVDGVRTSQQIDRVIVPFESITDQCISARVDASDGAASDGVFVGSAFTHEVDP